jgi:hypothetical protein
MSPRGVGACVCPGSPPHAFRSRRHGWRQAHGVDARISRTLYRPPSLHNARWTTVAALAHLETSLGAHLGQAHGAGRQCEAAEPRRRGDARRHSAQRSTGRVHLEQV